jgi:hypothetical protein
VGCSDGDGGCSDGDGDSLGSDVDVFDSSESLLSALHCSNRLLIFFGEM